ncbi:CTP synthase [Candidatus Thorarchaeota archaeon]|nr:CTP synthase [Candidatus Thorarchaeota archaeon]TFG95150.1 MAG: CTP synthase [Candidatus Thorarchaeota archaeon]
MNSSSRFIFISGGVLSGIGKGVTTASIAKLLQFRGYSVRIIKIDPYLNIDPGTLNPIEHGEVFVTDQTWTFSPVKGFDFMISEIDLDFGTYERFTGMEVHPSQNITSGQIYMSVILEERKGGFLGRTVQIIPHITDRIKQRIWDVINKDPVPDVLLVEIGGTVGDIEAMPFLEAVRQLVREVERHRVAIVHVTLVPYMKTVGEFKTKPTQHSARTLQSLGIQPDIMICRSEMPLSGAAKEKIALFCNVPKEQVISNPDISIIYQLPLSFEEEGLGDILVNHFALESRNPDTAAWREIVQSFENPKEKVVIAMPGKYTTLGDSYKSINEALSHAAAVCNSQVEIKWIETEDRATEECLREDLADVDGVLLTPGFGERGVEGMICAATVALNSKIPLLGICYGAQLSTVAFARKVMEWKGANTTEVDPDSLYPVVDLMDEQKLTDDKGGTMRLGGHEVVFVKGTRIHKIYGRDHVQERFRHRFHLIERYLSKMADKGLKISAYDSTGRIINAIELADHPFWIGVQYHPEFKSRPGAPHPLYLELIRAALEYRQVRVKI